MRVRANGTELFCKGDGSGRPMLLMHGGPGLDHTYLRPWLDDLGDTLRLIYYDQRGTGRSLRTRAFEGATLDTLVDDAEALRVHLGIERFILFGHSFGGCLALAYALRYGERLDGLILCATAPAFEHLTAAFKALADRANPEQRAVLARTLSEPMPDDTTLGRAWRVLLPLYFAKYQPEYGEAVLGRIRFSAAAWNHFGAILAELNANATRLNARCPVLLLEGQHDWFTPEDQVTRLKAALPHATLVQFEQSGHLPFVEEHERFVEVLRHWIADLH